MAIKIKYSIVIIDRFCEGGNVNELMIKIFLAFYRGVSLIFSAVQRVCWDNLMARAKLMAKINLNQKNAMF
ncbi:MAG: hypothetical protein Lm2023SU_04430 [Serratia ureilytica]